VVLLGGTGQTPFVSKSGDGAGAAEEGCVEMEGSVGVEEEKCGDTESESEEETPRTFEEPIFSQSVIEVAFDAQLTINLTEEFEKVLENYGTVALNIKYKGFHEVKQYLKDKMFPPTHILTWHEKWVVDMGPVV